MARIAYNDDQLATVKEEATRENVLDDQQQTVVTLWQGIKARATASMADREQLLAWDIENRISIFMLAAAEESGGTLPENFDQWAEDAGDQAASPLGEKRKRKDTYATMSKTLMSENQGLSGVSDLARILSNVTKHYSNLKALVLQAWQYQRDGRTGKSLLQPLEALRKTLEHCPSPSGLLQGGRLCRPQQRPQGRGIHLKDGRDLPSDDRGLERHSKGHL